MTERIPGLKGVRRTRFFLVVLDGVGLGAMPDAGHYGDEGSNTLVHTAEAVRGLSVPNFTRWGLGCLATIPGVPPCEAPTGAFALMAESSPGKDTTMGHWELAGLALDRPFPTYPDGFPDYLIAQFTTMIGRRILGNCRASGTEIIERLGAEHMATGYPIVYTSSDSVFQIAAHEAVVPPVQLYEWCGLARTILVGADAVARVIARPFTGRPGEFVRTDARRDFSLPPPGSTVLDALCQAGYSVIGLGKIEDIFAQRGLTRSNHTTNNESTLKALLDVAEEEFIGLIFANCVDFDMLYGHRNDPMGFAAALTEADGFLGRLEQSLRPGDLLCITGDHGCDPVTPSTDHSREYVPLLLVGPSVRPGGLGVRRTFADVGATIITFFGLPSWPIGQSFLAEIGLEG